MRSKRILMIFIVMALLAALTTSVYAATNSHSSTPNLVGTWKIMVHPEGMPEEIVTLHTYFADGNFVEPSPAPALVGASHGIWMGSGNTYVMNFDSFIFDEEGNYNGRQIVRASIKLDGADHLTAQWVMDETDKEGNVTENAFIGTFEGTRMEVQLP